MDNCCLFVSSSDNTFDVFSLVSGSVVRNWSSTDLAFYVGLNEQIADAPFRTIPAPVSGWRTELKTQINALPQKFQYIILLLDDFVFHDKIDSKALSRFLNLMSERELDYLRLKPLQRSLLGVFLLRFIENLEFSPDSVNKIDYKEPYYSSLQVTIWSRSHLIEMLTHCGSIWEFEHNVIVGSKHYAITKKLLNYEHLVEKGKWYKYAPRLLGFNETPRFDERGFVKSAMKNSKIWNKIKFGVLGYAFFKLRRKVGL
jgi:hypothetical protein